MSLPATPVVRVVVPCRNEARYIEACINSIVRADRDGMLVELWICDGSSEDGTRVIIARLAAQHPWVRLVDNPARTTPQAMNLGLRPPGYEVGIILGAHAQVSVDFFHANIEALRQHPEAGCVGGIIENVYEDATSRHIGAAMGHPFGVGSAHFRTGLKQGHVDTVAFGAYRREVFERIGYFDERLVRNQDDEFNYRVVKAGFRIWLSSSISSRYYVRGSFSKLFSQYRQYGYWKVYVNRLHATVTTWRQLVPVAFVGYLALLLLMSILFPALVSWYLLPLFAYVAISLICAFQAGGRAGCMGTWFAFFILHVSYGIGYWQGIVDFILLGRGPTASASELTR
jgi:GT2 family glycosyltransferase